VAYRQALHLLALHEIYESLRSPGTRDKDRLIDIADDYFVTARRDGKRAKYERIK